ncbi:hypothetical protein IE53DRAFT_385551 [Violaceomyces palustris]|uniref:Uncharacterized protein n=1 Tax=Violaceomyces palustris TaxID=1673888 RepID=A0ACD0P1W6_9BASI|nr:hypothetical protein IE53DRAFT_385551 [Violaceomyces palustris]
MPPRIVPSSLLRSSPSLPLASSSSPLRTFGSLAIPSTATRVGSRTPSSSSSPSLLFNRQAERSICTSRPAKMPHMPKGILKEGKEELKVSLSFSVPTSPRIPCCPDTTTNLPFRAHPLLAHPRI